MISIQNLHHTYGLQRAQPVEALKGIDLRIARREYVVIVGRNGSGKSTLARHLNALLLPTEGDVWINQMNTKDPQCLRGIRQTVGMVFQVPDNQLVATVVEEDVAFGPENMGLPRGELRERVDGALATVHMTNYRTRPPHMLSAGQKQRVAIAGALAMKPGCLVLDEATSMLDPQGRQEVMEVMRHCHHGGVTIISITHVMSEAVEADRVIVMDEGIIVMDGTPKEIFGHAGSLRQLGLDVPPVTQLAERLHRRHPAFPNQILSVDECVDQLCRFPESEKVAAWAK